MRRRRDPRRRLAPQESRDWWAEADVILRRRSGGRCECCGRQLRGAVERHHRVRRRDGGDRLSNLLYLRPECHTYWTEHPADARARGIIVSALGGADPSTVPVWHLGQRWVVLHDDGTTLRAQGSPPP